MKKEKFHIEFVMGNVTQSSLWRMISQPDGLSEWFADEVIVDEDKKQYTFIWNKVESNAHVQLFKPLWTIRLHWDEDDEETSYFEFALHKLELSGDMTLEITDFAEIDEKGDAITLWEKQIQTMKRKLGI